MSPESLWIQVRSSFESDDGSFPEIAIVDLEPDEVERLYTRIRGSGQLRDEDVTLWDYETNSSRLVAQVPNAAARVVTRKAAGFTFVMRGVSCNGVALPDLGFQIFESTIVLFYQMGECWNAKSVHALFSWLKALVSDMRATKFDLSHGPSDTFPAAWREFLSTSP